MQSSELRIDVSLHLAKLSGYEKVCSATRHPRSRRVQPAHPIQVLQLQSRRVSVALATAVEVTCHGT